MRLSTEALDPSQDLRSTRHLDRHQREEELAAAGLLADDLQDLLGPQTEGVGGCRQAKGGRHGARALASFKQRVGDRETLSEGGIVFGGVGRMVDFLEVSNADDRHGDRMALAIRIGCTVRELAHSAHEDVGEQGVGDPRAAPHRNEEAMRTPEA